MCWDTDERLYQPHIHSQHIRQLYRISPPSDGAETGQPMTVLLDQALVEFAERYRRACEEAVGAGSQEPSLARRPEAG
jgi:hypothetical protein